MDAKTEKLVDKKELSRLTGLTVSSIEKAMVTRSMPYYKIGRNVKFKVSEVNQWINQRKKVS